MAKKKLNMRKIHLTTHFYKYFCSVKRKSSILNRLILLFVVMFTTINSRAAGDVGIEYYDSVEIGLITCTPHEEIYSLYGHTALRLHNLHNGDDLSFNYGVFNYNQPLFVPRFVFGKTDYELGIAPFGEFCKYYEHWGSQVSELVLNLTAVEKARIVKALFENYEPENRVYRYNFFFDNCATRPRDVIERGIDGRIVYPQPQGEAPSFRDMIHDHTQLHPWAAMGNDLLLGVRADMSTTQRERHFLPENLERDFRGAVIIAADGKQRPLVTERKIVVKPGVQLVEPGFPLSPTACGILLMVAAAVVFVCEWRRKRTLVWVDAVLMTLMGLAGCLLVLMLFSEHPATSSNLQVLLLNPLHLLFLPSVVRRRRTTRYWTLLLALLALFILGGLWQHYAEGMWFLALCLLTRYWSHTRNDK